MLAVFSVPAAQLGPSFDAVSHLKVSLRTLSCHSRMVARMEGRTALRGNQWIGRWIVRQSHSLFFEPTGHDQLISQSVHLSLS